MTKLYKSFLKYGEDVAEFEVFRDWKFLNGAYLWIDARISFERNNYASTNIKIVYSFLCVQELNLTF